MHRGHPFVRLLEFYGTHLRHRGQWRVHASLRRWLNVSFDEECEVERDGLKWRLNPSNFVEADLFWLGSRDYWDVYHALRLVAAGAVIVDAGANFGYYSCKLAHSLGGACQVHAFEPLPQNYAKLVSHITINNLASCVTAYPVGLSDKEGAGRMVLKEGNSGAAYFVEDGGGVPVTTLDAWSEAHGVERIDFLKIDVEGFEIALLRGAQRVIQACRPKILIELNPFTLRRVGQNVAELVAMLASLGYELRVTKRDQLVELSTLPAGGNYVNAFCFPKAIRG